MCRSSSPPAPEPLPTPTIPEPYVPPPAPPTPPSPQRQASYIAPTKRAESREPFNRLQRNRRGLDSLRIPLANRGGVRDPLNLGQG
jgi:hypothetical protein